MAKTPERALGADGGGVAGRARARRARKSPTCRRSPTPKARGITIEPWDYRFYAEKVRKAKYDLDSDEVKQYLQLDKLREAMFYVAGELFGFRFTPVAEGTVPVFHPDVKVWEVTDKAAGAHVGLLVPRPVRAAGQALGRLGVELPRATRPSTAGRRCSPRTTPTSSRARRASRC